MTVGWGMVWLARLSLSRNSERIIVMSIHQPRYSIYKQFDSLTLLSQGNMVYHGAIKETLPYFINLGYFCEEHDNPADFLLDVINQCEGLTSATASTKINNNN
uniref:ABC transporter family G domain-containing protein n=1 Tax=Amphimedon queenslandica TaxID=400682 RepID=A0A1X7TGR7_AMPQE